jgi:hypothetical protein
MSSLPFFLPLQGAKLTKPIVPEDRSYSAGLAHCRAEMALLALEIRRDLEALRAEVAQL